MQYLNSKGCILLHESGEFRTPSLDCVVSDIVILKIFSQGIIAEDVNQLIGIVSEKTSPFKERDIFFVLISQASLIVSRHLPIRYFGKLNSNFIWIFEESLYLFVTVAQVFFAFIINALLDRKVIENFKGWHDI